MTEAACDDLELRPSSLRWIRERRGAFRIWRRDDQEATALATRLAADPDGFFAQGHSLPTPWQGTATDKVRVCFDDRTYFCKRYNRTGRFYRLRNALRPSRALRSLRAVSRFNSRGIMTPVPLVCLEERHGLLLGRSYLVFPYIHGAAGSFLDLWPRLDGVARQACLQGLGTLIGRMHRAGLLHGDLNWRNILVEQGAVGFRFWLVDLDGSRLVRQVRRRQVERDLAHFLRDLQRAGAAPELHEAFLAQWRAAASSQT